MIVRGTKSRSTVVATILLVTLLLTVFVLGIVNNRNNQPPVDQRRIQTGSGPISTTLQEALTIARDRALQWQPDAAALKAQSIDVGDPNPANAGGDGLRNSWDIEFTSLSDRNKFLIVDVISGTVDSVLEDSGSGENEPYLPQTIATDSPNAISIAKTAQPNLLPGGSNSRAKGYHFVLQPDSAGVPVINVMGELNGKPAMVTINASSGQISSSKTRTYDGGSVLYSSDSGLTWRVSNLLGKTVTALGIDPSASNTAYAVTTESTGLSFRASTNFGVTWSTVSQLPVGAGRWVYDITKLVGPPSQIIISSKNGMWKSTDSGQTWTQVTGLPSNDPFMMRRMSGATGEKLVVTFASGVYTSSDLVTWILRLPGAYFLSSSSDSQQIAAIDPLKYPSTVVVLTSTNQVSFTIPAGSLRMAGKLYPPTPQFTIAQNPGNVYEVQSVVGGNVNWLATLTNTDVSSLAVSPGFPLGGGVIVAGGLGIYRKTLASPVWTNVLPNPSDPIAVQAPPGTNRDTIGTGDITAIGVLDSTHIIAVNTGEERWQ